MQATWKNRLYFGDNLEILRKHVLSESVDLIYLDPPFNSNATYNVLFREKDGSESQAQVEAFKDSWHWTKDADETYREVVFSGGKLAVLLQALRSFLGSNDLMAYLTMMSVRLLELHRTLKPSGSLYLHCDSTAGHYVKVLLDAVFGPQNFRSQIVWKRQSTHNDATTRFADVADLILFYVKMPAARFRPIHVLHDPGYISRFYRHDANDGRGPFRLDNITSPKPRPHMMYEWNGFPCPINGWRFQRTTMERLHNEGRIHYPLREDGSYDTAKRPAVKRYLRESKGPVLGNVWTDIDPVHSSSGERLGYQTQKPEALLERIVTASSEEGDVILDPFCGCGTAIAVAERLRRRWLGIDITYLAIDIIKSRLELLRPLGLSDYHIIGEPQDVESARVLSRLRDGRHNFEHWAVLRAGARPSNNTNRADGGIDGLLNLIEPGTKRVDKVIVQVKSGHVSVKDIRDLVGTMQRENAVIGAFITLERPTRPMTAEALSAGYYCRPEFPDERYARVQIITVEELFQGSKIQHPKVVSG